MERHCENYLRLEGGKKEINRFVAKTRTEYEGETTYSFTMPEFVELPEDLKNPPKSEEEKQKLISKYGYDDADDWWMAQWGVGDPFVEAEYDEDTHSFTFVTFDSPSDKAVVAISKQCPALKFIFEYKNSWDSDDPIVNFGRFVCQNGKIESSEHGKVKAIFCPECSQVVTYEKI